MIHVLTPIRENEKYACDVTKQTIECKRFSQSCDLENRRDNEAKNRNNLKVHASEPYTVLMDADVILESSDTFAEMERFLDDYPIYGAVAIDTKHGGSSLARASNIGHTVIACVMVRKTILDSILFEHLIESVKDPALKERIHMREYPETDQCICTNVNLQIRQATGKEIPYLKGISATEKRAGE